MPFTCSSWELCRAGRATRAGADPGKSQTTSPVSQQLDSFAPGSPEQQLLAMWKKILVNHGGRLVFRAFIYSAKLQVWACPQPNAFRRKISNDPSGRGMGNDPSETGRVPRDMDAWALQNSDLGRFCFAPNSSTGQAAATTASQTLLLHCQAIDYYLILFFSIFTLSDC